MQMLGTDCVHPVEPFEPPYGQRDLLDACALLAAARVEVLDALDLQEKLADDAGQSLRGHRCRELNVALDLLFHAERRLLREVYPPR